jgi:hypothetical protein
MMRNIMDFDYKIYMAIWEWKHCSELIPQEGELYTSAFDQLSA